MLNWFKKDKHMQALADLLAVEHNKESLLGIKAVRIPTPDDIKADAAKIVRYSESKDYKVFAEEAWSRVLQHLDVMLDEKSNDDKVKYHRGALKETLDLLRLSYQARSIVEDRAVEVGASLPR